VNIIKCVGKTSIAQMTSSSVVNGGEQVYHYITTRFVQIVCR